MRDTTLPGAPAQISLRGAAHRNQGLFADHYLNETLPGRAEWHQLTAGEELETARARIEAIYAAYVPSAREAQAEEELIRPVLRALGHVFEVQPSLEAPGTAKTPDYVFYVDEEAKRANKDRKLTEALLAGRAYAVGDAKYWDRTLDASLKGGGDRATNANPSSQIDFYIRHSGLDWGILTNGRLWRLYHKDSSKHLDRYYEVDLPALLADDDPARFAYFYAFFGRRAFGEWELGVDAIRLASDRYAQAVSDSLKGQVFTALRHLAQGFLDYRRNLLSPDPPTLKAIYDSSLIVLYRLLFILYAEARELLPVRDNALYREGYSLEAVTRDILKGRPLLPGSDTIWARLRALFEAIDQGSPPLGIATYNGGLFDPERHRFIDTHAVGDHHLQLAIDQLARVDGQFVDYRDLAVRHLGTIYEGLLEFHLLPLAAPEDGWTVELRNDKGERHASGSYYTPDRIVAYMVDETLGPLLHTAVAGAASDGAKVEAVLGLNVLDMAMGSGHFLVEATEYIARFLVGLGLAPAEAHGEAELSYWRRRVAQACIYGVDLNPLAVDLAKLSLWLITVAKDRPLSFLDHHLRAGDALVGTRLDTLTAVAATVAAVVPAKKKRPAGVAANQMALFGGEDFRQRMSTAVDAMWLIEGSPAATLAEVKEQERLYEGLRQRLVGSFGTLANVLTAQHFGIDIDLRDMEHLALYALGKALVVPRGLQSAVDRVDALAVQRRFFHWELEFPEVFFDRHGQSLGERGGFDAVLGNPPYVRQEALKPLKPYLGQAFPETYHGVADLYVYFYQQGLGLTRPGGRMSYIVTNKWLRSGYGEPLRGYFAEQGALERLIDFGHAPIFEDADVFPLIAVLERQPATATGEAAGARQVRVTAFPREQWSAGADLARYVAEHSHAVPLAALGRAAWSLEHAPVEALLAKIRGAGVPLGQFAGTRPLYGVKTGLNEAFLIDTATRDRLVAEDPGCAAIIRPYLRGQDIKRWVPDWQKLWMIVLASSGDRRWPWSDLVDSDLAESAFGAAYPSLYAHVLPLADALKKRQDKGRFWWELRSCAYYEAFAQPKLLYQDITWSSRFTLDANGMMCNNTVYFMSSASPWLLTVLNSPLLWSFLWRRAVHGKDEALRLFSDFVETIPIAVPTDAILGEVEPAVARLTLLTAAGRQARRDLLDWLRSEFGVVTPGQRLEELGGMNEEDFLIEVRKRLPGKSLRLTPATLRALREGYAETATPLHAGMAEAATLERRLSALVNAAYGLTPEEDALLWETAPPRMPAVARPGG